MNGWLPHLMETEMNERDLGRAVCIFMGTLCPLPSIVSAFVYMGVCVCEMIGHENQKSRKALEGLLDFGWQKAKDGLVPSVLYELSI